MNHASEHVLPGDKEAGLSEIIESNIKDQVYKKTELKKDIYCKIFKKIHSLDPEKLWTNVFHIFSSPNNYYLALFLHSG